MTTFNTTGVVNQSITRTGTNEPFELQVSRGQIAFHSTAFINGTFTALGTAQATVWESGGMYVYPATAQVMEVSSSSANDTSAGTGARTVTIQGLDAGYNQIQETVILNGQTAVNTVNSYLRIAHLFVATAGTGLAAAGTIYVGTGTVTTGVPAVIYWSYTALNGSTPCIWTVPNGYTAYITSIETSSGNATANQWTKFSLFARPALDAPFDSNLQWICSNGGDVAFTCQYPLSYASQTDIEIRAASTVASTSVAANFQVVYIKNEGAL